MTKNHKESPQTKTDGYVPYVPYVPPPSDAPTKEIVNLSFADPFSWLAKGWRDMMAAKGIAMFYGVCFWLMALVLGMVFRNKPEYAMSIASGCLLVVPMKCRGHLPCPAAPGQAAVHSADGVPLHGY